MDLQPKMGLLLEFHLEMRVPEFQEVNNMENLGLERPLEVSNSMRDRNE